MPENIPAAEPSEAEAQASEERTYTEAEHKAAIEAVIKKRLGKYGDYEELKAKASEYETLKASQMSELEKAQKAAADAIAELEAERTARREAELSAVRARVGAEKGLPPALIEVLKGDDEESIAEHADTLLASIKPEPGRIDIGQGSRGTPPASVSNPLEAAIRSSLGI